MVIRPFNASLEEHASEFLESEPLICSYWASVLNLTLTGLTGPIISEYIQRVIRVIRGIRARPINDPSGPVDETCGQILEQHDLYMNIYHR